MFVIYRQQTPPSLTFVSPLAKLNLAIWIRSCCDAFTPQKYTCVQTRILLWTRINRSDFKLTHITFNHGACSLHLGLEQLKDRTIKSSTMSQVLCSTMGLLSLHLGLEQLKDRTIKSNNMSQVLCLTIILEFL